jgi:hypothetical protein
VSPTCTTASSAERSVPRLLPPGEWRCLRRAPVSIGAGSTALRSELRHRYRRPLRRARRGGTPGEEEPADDRDPCKADDRGDEPRIRTVRCPDPVGRRRARVLAPFDLPVDVVLATHVTDDPEEGPHGPYTAHARLPTTMTPTPQIILRGGVEVENPLELALEFLAAYSSYDACDPSGPASFDESDLRLYAVICRSFPPAGRLRSA